jgi:hypothetical protein
MSIDQRIKDIFLRIKKENDSWISKVSRELNPLENYLFNEVSD